MIDRDAYLDRLRALVDKHGWAVQGVGADVEAGVPGFAYTVGLAKKGLPELIVLGLPMDAAQPILNTLARRMVDGESFEDGSDIIEAANLPLRLQTLEGAHLRNWVRFADLMNGEPVGVRQLVWPDRDGRFPTDPGVDGRMAAMQDLGLYRA